MTCARLLQPSTRHFSVPHPQPREDHRQPVVMLKAVVFVIQLRRSHPPPLISVLRENRTFSLASSVKSALKFSLSWYVPFIFDFNFLYSILWRKTYIVIYVIFVVNIFGLFSLWVYRELLLSFYAFLRSIRKNFYKFIVVLIDAIL
jgi:hypothetical protein